MSGVKLTMNTLLERMREMSGNAADTTRVSMKQIASFRDLGG